MSRVLVTGAAGFIRPASLIRCSRADRVTGVDNSTPSIPPRSRNETSPRPAHPNDALARIDIASHGVLALATRSDTIIHLAARAGVRPSIADPRTYPEINVAGRGTWSSSPAGGNAACRLRLVQRVYGVDTNIPVPGRDSVLGAGRP